MNRRMLTCFAALVAAAASLTVTGRANAQAWHYPAFQTPEVSQREFNFAVAGGSDYGTTGLVQWREGLGPDTHIGFDLGFASPSGLSTGFLLGAGIGQQLVRSTVDMPIDLMLTGGLYGDFSSDVGFLRIPIGVVAGHKFPLQHGMALTPYAAPRLSIDACVSSCNGQGTTANVNFDLGLNWDINSMLALRGALTVGAVGDFPSKTGFGFGLAFHPATIRH
jgi:hypothetical protein